MKLLFLIVPLILLLGCDSPEAQVKRLEKEVIKIHDEVMPKNIDINRVNRQLKKMVKDSLINDSILNNVKDQIFQLTKAEDSMNKWMVEYKSPSRDMPFEQTMEYLNKEKVKITQVKELMLSSLENGNKLLEALKKSK